jgi:protein-disulfide isomerase
LGAHRMAAGRAKGQGSKARVVKKRRPTKARGFYILLAAVAIGGGIAIGSVVTRSKAPLVRDADVTAAQAEGYLLGNPNAPVQVLEFADFECPACAQYALVTEPDVRHRLVESGQVNYRYFDFPLPMHRNTIQASMAAACADDQHKFWEMHDALFFSQPEWSTGATSNPVKFFSQYAKRIGLNYDLWKECMDGQRHMVRIIANRKEGERRAVGQTPTFVFGRKVFPGALTYDEFKAFVDSMTPPPASAPAKKP